MTEKFTVYYCGIFFAYSSGTWLDSVELSKYLITYDIYYNN